MTDASPSRGLVALGLTILSGVALFVIGVIVAVIRVFLKGPRNNAMSLPGPRLHFPQETGLHVKNKAPYRDVL